MGKILFYNNTYCKLSYIKKIFAVLDSKVYNLCNGISCDFKLLFFNFLSNPKKISRKYIDL